MWINAKQIVILDQLKHVLFLLFVSILCSFSWWVPLIPESTVTTYFQYFPSNPHSVQCEMYLLIWNPSITYNLAVWKGVCVCVCCSLLMCVVVMLKLLCSSDVDIQSKSSGSGIIHLKGWMIPQSVFFLSPASLKFCSSSINHLITWISIQCSHFSFPYAKCIRLSCTHAEVYSQSYV